MPNTAISQHQNNNLSKLQTADAKVTLVYVLQLLLLLVLLPHHSTSWSYPQRKYLDEESPSITTRAQHPGAIDHRHAT